MVTFVGGMFGIFPETSQSTVLDLTPGRYVAICFFPEGATPEVFEQMMAAEAAAEGSIPAGSAPDGFGAPRDQRRRVPSTLTWRRTPRRSTPATAGGSTPADGSAPAGGEGTPHFMLGMVQEFTVV